MGETERKGTSMEENANTDEQQDVQEPAAGAQEQQGEKTFSQKDVNAIIARETAKLQKKFETQLDEKLTEAQKMAKMNAEQKADYERKQAEKRLNEREAGITRRELMASAKDVLLEKKLDTSLAEILDYTDAEACNKSIDTVVKVVTAAIEKGVDMRIKASASVPKAGTGGTASGVEAAFYALNPRLKH